MQLRFFDTAIEINRCPVTIKIKKIKKLKYYNQNLVLATACFMAINLHSFFKSINSTSRSMLKKPKNLNIF